MAELEVENTYYEPITETETVFLCDACGEPCEENSGRYPVAVLDGWDETYDLCGRCVSTLAETNQSLQMVSRSGARGFGSRSGASRESVADWVERGLTWTRGSVWRFVGVVFLVWFGAGLLTTVAEPLGGFLLLGLIGWIAYEAYRQIRNSDHETLLAAGAATGSRLVDRAAEEIDSRLSELEDSQERVGTVGPDSRRHAGQMDGSTAAPFEWYGDTDVTVDEVLDHIDADLDRQTRVRIKASVEKHRDSGDAVDAADIRWIAEASEQLDLEGDHP